MELKTLLSWGYWFSAYSLGLLLHPYVTVRKMVREHFLRPLVVLPLVSTVLLWLTTVVVVHSGAVILNVFDVTMPVRMKFVLSFVFWWMVWFLGLWQILLGYLWLRFWRAIS